MKYIMLTQDMKAIVDDEDYEYLNQWEWYYDKKWNYAKRGKWVKDKYKNIFLHQFIAILKYGPYNPKLRVDHINRDSLDCRKENIRLVTPAQSSQNRGIFKNKKRGKYVGVRPRPSGRWQTVIGFENKELTLGTFDTEEEAARAYNKKAKELYGEFASLNKIEE